jgi:hypothetical protein
MNKADSSSSEDEFEDYSQVEHSTNVKNSKSISPTGSSTDINKDTEDAHANVNNLPEDVEIEDLDN